MFRKILLAFLFVAAGFILPAPARATEWKIATMMPEGSRYFKIFKDGARDISQATAGRVEIKYLAGGVMGDDEAILKRMKSGELDGAAVAGPSLGKIDPACLAYSLPLEFESTAEVAAVRARLDPVIVDSLSKTGLVCLGLAGGGFAYVMSTKPADSFDDFRHLKLWVPPRQSFSEIARTTGLNPVPVPMGDVRAALQSGTLEAAIGSPIGAIVQRWHSELKYLVDLPLIYLYSAMVVDQKKFAALSPEDQKAFRTITVRFLSDLDQLAQRHNGEALDVLRKQGIAIRKPSAENLVKWNAWARTVETELARQEPLPTDLISQIEKQVEGMRAKQGK